MTVVDMYQLRPVTVTGPLLLSSGTIDASDPWYWISSSTLSPSTSSCKAVSRWEFDSPWICGSPRYASNAEVSASLDMSGPPFGGVVHVEFWVFGFDVNFGAPPQPPPAVNLERFWNVVLKSSESSPPSMLTSDDGMKKGNDNKDDEKKKQDNPAILLTCESGLEPAPPGTTAKDDDPWLRLGFEVQKDEVTKTGDEQDGGEPDKINKRKPAPLVGKPPKELLRRFKTTVPAVPLVAVGR
ncbi:uncharacterized protein Triagg1_7766 [Trichoderma aggressivum f. europaeum]|uniref:DUF6603 domain-containing protein n=1 Tax=Trichoderma aggressivum f. europaeum TaxID=173218 RepID=A0AAE1M2L0_9HYPO|nr:hypothetical protein Triagg1_7766 [Trichoderma aggressivum f. europaeum]